MFSILGLRFLASTLRWYRPPHGPATPRRRRPHRRAVGRGTPRPRHLAVVGGGAGVAPVPPDRPSPGRELRALRPRGLDVRRVGHAATLGGALRAHGGRA